jgi:hypothetical protein
MFARRSPRSRWPWPPLASAGIIAAAAVAFTAPSALAQAPNCQPVQGLDPGEQTPTWTGEAIGNLVQSRTIDEPDSNPDPPDMSFHSQSDDSYRATIRFCFNIDRRGLVFGTGRGEYQEAKWHLSGKNRDKGQFDCDVPITAEPFDMQVSGDVVGRQVRLTLYFAEAAERNDDYDCGADFTGRATTSSYLWDSFQVVAPSGNLPMSFDMGNPTVAPLTAHVEQDDSSGDTTNKATRDHEWKFTIRHSCGETTTDPSSSDYIQQYDLGATNDFALHRTNGGDACGPSSLVSAVNSYKPPGVDPVTDIQTAYDATIRKACGGTWCFDSAAGRDYLRSLGYLDTSLGFGIDFINQQLGAGWSVLASTTFGAAGNGTGHVILITGRTQGGDYVVNDPAGDWAFFTNANDRYGPEDCGGNVVYTQSDLRDHAQGRWAIGVPPTPGADPLVLGAIGRFKGGGTRPYDLVIQDRSGRRSGFRGGDRVLQIASSAADLDAPLPSNPGLPPGPAPPPQSSWPYAVSVVDPGDGTRISIRGRRRARYALEIYAIQNGGLVRRTVERGTISPGEIETFAPDFRPPASRIASFGRRPSKRRLTSFSGAASDRRGVRRVTYTLQDAETGRYYHRSRFGSARPRPLPARIARGRGGRKVMWTARIPGALRAGRTYVLRVSAQDRVGNREQAFSPGRNLVRFTLRR